MFFLRTLTNIYLEKAYRDLQETRDHKDLRDSMGLLELREIPENVALMVCLASKAPKEHLALRVKLELPDFLGPQEPPVIPVKMVLPVVRDFKDPKAKMVLRASLFHQRNPAHLAPLVCLAKMALPVFLDHKVQWGQWDRLELRVLLVKMGRRD